MKIEMKLIKDINPSEYNPRAISKESLSGLKRSLEKFGMTQPLVINRRVNGMEVLVGGHQRCRAASELGWEKVPVIYVELSEVEEKTLNVVLNNKNIEGFFTDELQVILDEIKLELGDLDFVDLKLDNLVMNWESDLDKLDPKDSNDSLKKDRIMIECPPDIKDEVLIYIKAKLMETSFEGIHVR